MVCNRNVNVTGVIMRNNINTNHLPSTYLAGSDNLSCAENEIKQTKVGVRKNGKWFISAEYKIALVFTILNLLFQSGSGYTPRTNLPGRTGNIYRNPHHCYVCLPNDKNSNTAKDIQNLFPERKIEDCSSFDPHSQNAHQESLYKLSCPMGYKGCLLRSSGSEVARTCTPNKFDDCKTVNSIELCYCPQSGCNRDKSSMILGNLVDETRTLRHNVNEDIITDDEDMFSTDEEDDAQYHRTHHNLDELEGSGLGVLDSARDQKSNYNPLTPAHTNPTSHEDVDDEEKHLSSIPDDDIQTDELSRAIETNDHENIHHNKHNVKMGDEEIGVGDGDNNVSDIPKSQTTSSSASNNKLVPKNLIYLSTLLVPLSISSTFLVNVYFKFINNL